MLNFILYQAIGLAAGFALYAFAGGLRNFPDPVRLIERLIEKTEKKVRKKYTPTRKSELKAGGILALCVAAPSALVPLAISAAAYLIHPFLYAAAEALMCCFILSSGKVRKNAERAVKSQKDSIRNAVGEIAKGTSETVIAPAFYAAIGGGALGFLYKAFRIMDSEIGYKDKNYLYLGRCAARIDDILGFVPARITALIMIISSYLLGFDTFNAIKVYKRDAKKTDSPNSGQMLSVCAGALDVCLENTADKCGIGDAVRDIEMTDIKNAARLMHTSSVMALAAFVLVKLLIWKWVRI